MNKSIRIFLYLIVISIFILGVIGVLFPTIYADFYLKKMISQSWIDFYRLNSELGRLIKVLFQANGLGMVMSSILAFFIITYALQKREKWGVIALIFAGLIGGSGEIILEFIIFYNFQINTMITELNFISLITTPFLYLYFYIKSVKPATLEKKIGSSAYKKSKNYRIAASVFMLIALINYIIYFFYPISFGLPIKFQWNYIISLIIAIVVLIPSVYLFIKGMIDAGEETLTPKKDHELYTGIYLKIRHPQALGEFLLWITIPFFLNSPFLLLFSIIWLPIHIIMCKQEEKDLRVRYGNSYKEYKNRTGFFFFNIRKEIFNK